MRLCDRDGRPDIVPLVEVAAVAVSGDVPEGVDGRYLLRIGPGREGADVEHRRRQLQIRDMVWIELGGKRTQLVLD